MSESVLTRFKKALALLPDLEFAVLVGSRAEGKGRVHSRSDWDIALQWKRELTLFENLGNTETLRRKLAAIAEVEESLIDLIHLPNAGLAMRALVAEEGVVLNGENRIEWNHFLSRTWREIEDFEWEKQHAS